MIIEQTLSKTFSYLAAIKSQEFLEFYFPKNSHSPNDTTQTSYYNRYQEFIQRLTLTSAADISINETNGNLLEIGAAEGLTTCCLAEIAKKYNKKLFVIDPYNGEECGSNWVYQQFLNNTNKYANIITHIRLDSRSPAINNLLIENSFSFCYVDGLHSQDAPANDINLSIKLLKSSGVLCVDDTENLNSIAGKYLNDKYNNKQIIPILADNNEYKIICDDKTWHFGIKP